jgi:hypothetical protein
MTSRASAFADPRRLSIALGCVVACAMLTIMLDHGIRIGMENHSGMLPVVRRILDPSYLPGDFGIEIREHHHRIFAMLVAALAGLGLGETGALVLLTWAGFALLFAGLWHLATRLQLSTARRVVICVALATGFAYLDRGVEANRLLGNGPIMPPTFAHAFILFSLSALVGKRWNLAFACAGAVALLHLQIGAAWLLVLAVLLVWRGAWREPREWLPGLVIASLIASPALLDLVALVREGLVAHIADTRDVAFRMPQHFRVYPGRLAIVLAYLAVMAALAYRWRHRDRELAMRFAPLLAAAVVIVALTLVHYLDYYVIGSGWIARMQLLRLSVFVPLLGALAIVAAIPEPSAQRAAPLLYVWWIVALVLPVAACVNLIIKDEPPSLRIHDEALAADDWADICRRIRVDGPVGLYVTPPGNQGFGAFSHRSTLVEFKVNPDGGAGLDEWRSRLLALSGGTFPTVEGRREMAEALNGAYARLPAEHFAALRERYGVRYAVVPTGSPLRGTTVLANRGYRVVAL